MPSVTYSSTRGGQKNVDFRTVVMQGLARDKGLFVPDEFPAVSAQELQDWRNLSYPDLAVQVIRKFVGEDQVPFEALNDIVHRSCAAFRHEDVTPVIQVGGHAIMELFHGPTFAFKDVALQMLGNFFEYFLSTGSNGGHLAVLGATSGDTGSAAMAGLRGKRGVHCIILFPKGRVSPRQELQMTTVPDENVHAVAVENATFDDCQDMVKASFNTPAFRDQVHLGAVNSINWCRVLAQTTYYFWSYFQVTSSSNIDLVNYSVPTGNFGDVLAGFYSKQMGLPVGRLIVATNENDILNRFFTTGKYHRESIQKTISPSMDICVSSNFERYLYFLAGNNASRLADWMSGFEKTHELTIEGDLLKQAQKDFGSARVDTAATLQTIKDYHVKHDYVLCPHSAVGVEAMHKLNMVNPQTVCLATAHEGKFPAAVSQAVNPLPPVPPQLGLLEDLPNHRTILPKDLDVVQAFVRDCVFDTNKTGKLPGNNRKVLMKRIMWSAAVAGVVAVAVQYMSRRR